MADAELAPSTTPCGPQNATARLLLLLQLLLRLHGVSRDKVPNMRNNTSSRKTSASESIRLTYRATKRDDAHASSRSYEARRCRRPSRSAVVTRMEAWWCRRRRARISRSAAAGAGSKSVANSVHLVLFRFPGGLRDRGTSPDRMHDASVGEVCGGFQGGGRCYA